MSIQEFSTLIPRSLLRESGSVFYSGRSAFDNPSRLYILGLNPGGCPVAQSKETLEWHTRKVVEKELPEWSAYTDEQWDHSGKPGNCGMQPRVRHLLRRLNLDPRRVPASNLVFVRTPRERNLRGIFDGLAEQCWPFHQTVIEKLGVCVVLVFGKRAGLWVRNKLDAHAPVEEFIENNNRRWRSQSFMNTHGIAVMVATHPSIADWTNPKTDPSPLMGRLLESV